MLARARPRPTLGFFVSELENPYAQTLCRGITDAAAAADANVIMFPGKSPKVPYNYRYQYNAIYRLASRANIDALILATGTMVNFLNDAEFREFCGRYHDIPLVSISIPVDGVSSLLIDNTVGLRDALEHLVTVHNIDKIAFIGGPESNVEAQERLSVYIDVLKKYEFRYDPNLVVTGDFTKFSGVRAVSELLDARGVTFGALAAANDEMALSAMEELQRRGVKVPEDVAVIGFDDIENAHFSTPPLTTVAQPIYEQAYKAVELACQLIGDGVVKDGQRDKISPRSVTLPTTLILRESCGCAALSPSMGLPPATRVPPATQVLPARSLSTISTSTPAARLAMLEDYFKTNSRRLEAYHRGIVGLRDVLSLLISDVTNPKTALRAIVPNLREMGMECFYVFLHEAPERHDIDTNWRFSGTIRAIVADGGHAEESGGGHDPGDSRLSGRLMPVNEVLDRSLYPRDRRYVFVVSSLFYMDEHFGFIICEPNLKDVYLFESLVVEIGCALKLINLVHVREKMERQLQMALTDLEKYNKQLSSMSETDELTGLLNRRGFLNHTRHTLAVARRLERDGLLFFADLDGLKTINDTYGHDEGDVAIMSVAAVFRKAFRESDVIARLGGDEFTIFTINTNPSMLKMFEDRVASYMEAHNKKAQKPYKLSISMGAVPFEHDDEASVEALMQRADALLYMQKKEKMDRAGNTRP